MNIAPRDITGVILAGGRGSRLGGVDKGLVPLHGRPLIEHVIDALRPQVGALLISANRNRDIYASYGYPVIADVMGDYDGPLAGMLSAMRAAGTAYILTTPCDAPSIPADLARRLAEALDSKMPWRPRCPCRDACSRCLRCCAVPWPATWRTA
jgi:molybdenum cofactor guanylyltransferase